MKSPFVGLVPFDDESRQYFFGREAEIRLVTDNAFVSRLTLVYGPSGAGKSSVLGAGLLPRLRGTGEGAAFDASGPDYPVGVMWREWTGQPLDALRRTISDVLGPWGLNGLEFPQAWLRAPGRVEDGPPLLVLVLDQFEELFIQHPELASTPPARLLQIAAAFTRGKTPEATPGLLFAGALVALLNTGGCAVNVVLTLREDCLASLDALKGIVPELFSTLLRIERIDEAGLRASVEQPLARWSQEKGAAFQADTDLVRVLLSDTKLRHGENLLTDKTSRRYEALFLQLVLERLWTEDIVNRSLEATGGTLTTTTFRNLKGAEGIIGNFVEGTLRKRLTQPAEQRWFLEATRLLVSKTQKFPWTVSDLLDEIIRTLKEDGLVAAPSGEQLRGLLDQLRGDGLLREVPMRDRASTAESWEARFEVAHDALASEIYRWRVTQLGILEQQRQQQIEKQAILDRQQVEKRAILERQQAEMREAHKKFRDRILTVLGVLLGAVILLGLLAWQLVKANTSYQQAADELKVQTVLEHLASAATNIEDIKKRGFLDPDATSQAFGTVKASLDNSDSVLASIDPHGDRALADALDRARQNHANILQSLTAVSNEAREAWDDSFVLRPVSNPWPTPTPTASPTDSPTATPAATPAPPAVYTAADSTELRHDGAVTWLAFSPPAQPGGQTVATSSVDKNVRLWDLQGNLLQKRSASTEAVNMVAFSPDGGLLASASNGSTVRLYQFANKNTSALESQADSITAVDFRTPRDPGPPDPGANFLASASADRTVYVYNASTGKAAYFSSPKLPGIPTFVQFSHGKGDLLVSSADDGGVRLHSWVARNPPVLLTGLTAPARRANFSADDRWVTACSGDGQIAVWQVGSPPGTPPKMLLVRLASFAIPIFQASFSPRTIGGSFRVAAGGADRVVRLWDFEHAAEASEARLHQAPVRVVAWSSDARWLATADSKGDAVVWAVEADSLKPSVFLSGHNKIIRHVVFSPDDRVLATCSDDGTARLWPATLWQNRRP